MAKNKYDTVAFIYDFDGTLSPDNMQEYGFIKAIGKNADEFWAENARLSKENDASNILCYMYLMIKMAQINNISLKRESFQRFGKDVELFEGVKDWFARINSYGRSKGLDVKHYIISSGLKEMIEGTAIADEFEKIFACSFLYNVDGVAYWPAVAVDYTAKTQFLFKINKGINEVSDNSRINEYKPEDERPVPFTSMVYFGDGETDVPCMKMIKEHGGHAVAVYKPKDARRKKKALQLISDGRANFVSPADYSDGREIDRIAHIILDKIAVDLQINKLLKEHAQRAE